MRLQVLKDKITEWRTSAQQWQRIKEFTQTCRGPGKKTGISPSTTNLQGHNPKSLIVYNSPKNDPACRICQILKSNGDTNNLYKNHHSNFATGCPRFITQSLKDLACIGRLANICLSCHNPDCCWKKQDKDHNCGTFSVNRKKSQLRLRGDSSKLM